MNKEFSVILTIYYGTSATELKECLESINVQTLLPSLVIIVADGPISDELHTTISSFSFKFKHFFLPLTKNVGPGSARNQGVKLIDTDFFAVMDSDDVCLPNRFELQMNCFIANPSLDVVGGKIIEFHENLSSDASATSERKIFFLHEDIVLNRLSVIPVNNVTAMIRTSSFLRAGGYPELRFGEDYLLWLVMINQGCTFRNIDDYLVKVRMGQHFHLRRSGFLIFTREVKYLWFMYKFRFIHVFRFSLLIARSFIVRMMPKYFYLKLRSLFNK